MGDESEEISDLELVHWVEEKSSMRGKAVREGKRVDKPYDTFQELYDAILEHGALVVATDRADAMFFTPDGRFDGDLIAVRQSGRNMRRFLISRETFQAQFGAVSNLIDHVLSNNAVDCVLEMAHLRDMAEKLNLSPNKIDRDRKYDRLEIDVVAAMQVVSIFEEWSGTRAEDDGGFELGYCVGRLFSSAQNLVTLEPDASKAGEYRQSYAERGKKGRSKDRRAQRLDHLFRHLVALVEANSAFSRLKPIEVGRLAMADAAQENPTLWSQGKGQLDQYLSHYASDPNYRSAFYGLFPQTA